MCGRFTLTVHEEEILEHYQLTEPLEDYRPRYNVAPGQWVWGVVRSGEGQQMRRFKWGLVPFWAKTPKIGYRTFNARAETVAAKAAFRTAFRRSRVLIAADSFFEWKALEDKKKQPMRMMLKSKEIYSFAGLWDSWKAPDGSVLESCTIITTTPNEVVGEVHDRMPVLLPQAQEQAWLDPDTGEEELLQLLRPYPSQEMFAYQVSSKVGSVKNDGAYLIEELNSK
ncbi:MULTISPECIES: SOS response-associated peptidase [Paenibacillus]|uniref:SOS response-associated peptidase n=1 Tax=Paenibacillus TaxID=44249 RepID=UPI0022B8FE0E|nr:SOS response-associated peptidase [Paenibacillus caseinilyticus]MCZ8522759.1 SOS response-associated peptidase [Paenibacillus caseinilyticus]